MRWERVSVYGGPAGTRLYVLEPHEFSVLGRFMDAGRDVDADGVPDLVLAARTLLKHDKILTVSGQLAVHGAPALSATGTLQPASPLTLSLAGGPPAGNAWLVVGLGALNVPFKNGYLLPQPDWIVPALPLTSAGGLQIPTTWPAGLSAPFAVVLQAWCPEPAAAQGFVASNGLMLAPP
jgi:hypothetical protein